VKKIPVYPLTKNYNCQDTIIAEPYGKLFLLYHEGKDNFEGFYGILPLIFNLIDVFWMILL